MPNGRWSAGRPKVVCRRHLTRSAAPVAASSLTHITPLRRHHQAKRARKRRRHRGGGSGRGNWNGDHDGEDHGANYGHKCCGFGCCRDEKSDNPSGMRSIMTMVVASAGNGAKKKAAMGGGPAAQVVIVPVRVPICTCSCPNC